MTVTNDSAPSFIYRPADAEWYALRWSAGVLHQDSVWGLFSRGRVCH
jgi:hypothetical protein